MTYVKLYKNKIMTKIFSNQVKSVPREYFLGPYYAKEKDEVVKDVHDKRGMSADGFEIYLKKRGYKPDRRSRIIDYLKGDSENEKKPKKGFWRTLFS